MNRASGGALLILALGGTIVATPTQAGTTQTLNVSAGIVAGCEVSGQAGAGLAAATLDFGTRDQLASQVPSAATPSSGAGALTVKCNAATSGVTVAVGLGQNASGNTRRMAAGSTYVDYELYRDAAWSQPVGSAAISLGAFSAGQATSPALYGRIPQPSQAIAQSGLLTTYTDQVALTITF